MSLLNIQQRLIARLLCSLPSLSRPFSASVTRQRDSEPTATAPPKATGFEEPQQFLKAIGRDANTKWPVEDWAKFWNADGRDLRAAGVGVKDRRYILWCRHRYLLGFPIREFAHEAPPKKTIRGWGPKVQNGKRIRSRRLKDK